MTSNVDTSDTNLFLQIKSIYKLLDGNLLLKSDDLVMIELLSSGKPYQLLPTDLMKRVHLSSGAMTALINRLADQGIIDRKKHKNDDRKNFVVLTGKGITWANKLQKSNNQTKGFISEILDDLEQLQLRKTLRKIEERLKAI